MKKLIPDDEADQRIEALIRTKTRLEYEIRSRKALLAGTVEELTIELRKHANRAYVRGGLSAFIERTEKIVTECSDETGETE